MGEKLLLVGGGGHCRSIIDSLDMEKYSDIKMVDNTPPPPYNPVGISFAGCDENALRLYEVGYKSAVITVGSVGNPSVRIKLYQKFKEMGFEFPPIIDPTAVVSKYAAICEGVFIGKGAIVNFGCHIGICAIVNSGAVIDHDCNIGDFVHIGPNASLSGDVNIGNNSHIGVGSTVIQSVRVGENAVIGAGSVVIRDIPNDVTGVGVPCKVIKPD